MNFYSTEEKIFQKILVFEKFNIISRCTTVLVHYNFITLRKNLDSMELRIQDLSFCYKSSDPDVLQMVNLAFETGEVVGLLGPNGAGKSTLLYLIAGALTPTNGSISFDGVSTRLRRPEVLAHIYLVPEEVQLPRMSLTRFVELNSKFYPDFNMEIMKDALREFDMDKPERIDTLSMGQKKKIILSFAFACNTPVVLMDEPTNGLDIPGKAAFRRLVARLASDERLFLISTHQVRDLDTILDRVTIMNARQFLFNERIVDIQRHFTFVNGSREVPDTAIYALRSLGGNDYMTVNDTDAETEVNLELLFESVLKKPMVIKDIIQNSNR